MKKFLKNRCVFGLIIFVLIVSVVVGIINATKHEVPFSENVVQIVITPFQKLFGKMGNGVSGFWGYFSDVDKLRQENELLKKEKAELEAEFDKATISLNENEQLRKLLEMKKQYPELEFKAAEVIAREPSNWYDTFTIDKGAIDGMALNQPVVSEDKTLVGRISEVGTTWSRVTTITDPSNAVGAEVVRSGEYGIVEGEYSFSSSGTCRLNFISKNANIIVGDKVVTSGLGGIYPKGLTIGKVLEIRPDMQGISQYAVIAPQANVNNLKAVLVVLNPSDET